jgi:hypothetical protein
VEAELGEALQERVEYTKERLEEARSKLKQVQTDRSYLFVSKHIRPSEKEPTLAEQKADHEKALAKLQTEIDRSEKIISTSIKELDSLGIKLTQEGEAGAAPEAGAEEEWVTMQDEASGAYYYQNTRTGETQWA